MARLARYFIKGAPLHIILRGNNRELIFANDEDCQFFKEALLDAAKRHAVGIRKWQFSVEERLTERRAKPLPKRRPKLKS